MDNIHVILTRAKRSGNVGLVARAMKNTGLSHLVLVRGVDHRSKIAQTFGAPAKEILDSAVCFPGLEEALGNSTYAVGFTRREGKMRSTLKSFLDLVPAIVSRARTGSVALVFGNERTGLSTQELDQCDVAVYLPSNPQFPSMNLSHAVMLAGYELLKASMGKERLGGVVPSKPKQYPVRKEVEIMFAELSEILRRLAYRDVPELKLLTSIMRNCRNLAKRAEPTVSDVNMMRGIFARLKQRLPVEGAGFRTTR